MRKRSTENWTGIKQQLKRKDLSGKTYYEILNLPEGASKAEIKKSYRALVKLYHPDVTDDPKAHEKYLEINQAYEALTEPQKTKNKPNSHNSSTRENKWNKYSQNRKRLDKIYKH